MEKIQELTEKLYREGVEKGKEEAQRIVEEGKQQAAQIVADARRQAEALIQQAQNLNIIRKLVMNLLKGLDLPVATKKKNLTIGNKQTLCLKNEKCLLYALQNL